MKHFLFEKFNKILHKMLNMSLPLNNFPLVNISLKISK